MSRFARPAGWLRQIFTPSQTGQPNPDSVSNDVSLVQPYDGGGYPISDVLDMFTVNTVVAAQANTTILTLNQDQIGRILALTAVLLAGVAPTVQFMNQGAFGSVISANMTPVVTEYTAVEFWCPILKPGHQLRGRHFGGDAATQVTYIVHVAVAPVGSVFRP